jgi:putative membrane protein
MTTIETYLESSRKQSRQGVAMSDLATIAATTTLADHYDGPGWWPLIPLFWFTAFIVFFFVAARLGWWGRRRYCGGHDGYYGDSARESRARLADRFAAGEIDEQEYRSRLAVLDDTSTVREGRDR